MNDWRVKYYELEEGGFWNDRGTGFASISPSQHIVVVSEETRSKEKPLLESLIRLDITYERQGDNIIMWREGEGSRDFALSFQDIQGCNFTWEQLRSIQTQFLQQRDYGIQNNLQQYYHQFANTNIFNAGTGVSGGDSSYLGSSEGPMLSEALINNYYASSSGITIGGNRVSGAVMLLPPLSDINCSLSCLTSIKDKLIYVHPLQREYLSAQILDQVTNNNSNINNSFLFRIGR